MLSAWLCLLSYSCTNNEEHARQLDTPLTLRCDKSLLLSAFALKPCYERIMSITRCIRLKQTVSVACS